MQPFHPNLQDKPSLQRGLRLYVNYCMGCHSLKFQRYERTADDLEIPHDIVMANLVFTGQKIGALMTNAMPPEMAQGVVRRGAAGSDDGGEAAWRRVGLQLSARRSTSTRRVRSA